jgi:hypothetical protein
MNVRHSRLARLVALTVVVSMPLVGMAGMASAAKVKAAAKVCAKHPNRAKCAAGGGGATGGTGGTPPNIIVSVSPDPVQEVGTSEIDFVVQVEALAIFANQTVNISSQQLSLDCLDLVWRSSADNTPSDQISVGLNSPGVTGVILDNDGNATVEVQGEDCAPGANLVEADLNGAPYTTATATLTATPPGVTAPQTITGSPNPEVETGDGAGNNSESQVYANFLVEEDSVYAEQLVDVTSNQLTDRCELGKTLWTSTPGLGGGGVKLGTTGVTAVLDNDGNAVVTFEGISCAAGESLVDAELVGGTGDTFTTEYIIKPPAVTDI